MIEGVTLYGGFSGDETTLDERDWTRNLTVLSGDIGESGNQADNSMSVVKGADDAIIDGFVIEDGYAIQET